MSIISHQIDEVACACLLAENPLWDHRLGVLCWIDIEAGHFYRYDLDTRRYISFNLPHRIGSFGLTNDTNKIIAAFECGIAFYHLNTGQIEWIAKPESHLQHTRFNDGRVDPNGRFWAGTMVESDKLVDQSDEYELGSLYCLDLDRKCKRVLNDISISNGLCWHPNGNFVYHADSPKQLVKRYDYDRKAAEFSRETSYIDTLSKGYPDGGICDKYGRYWHARWADASVVCVDFNGGEIDRLELPVTQVSAVAIGGPCKDLLFVTSASIGLNQNILSKQGQAGNVFVFQLTEAIGLDEHICQIC